MTPAHEQPGETVLVRRQSDGEWTWTWTAEDAGTRLESAEPSESCDAAVEEARGLYPDAEILIEAESAQVRTHARRRHRLVLAAVTVVVVVVAVRRTFRH